MNEEREIEIRLHMLPRHFLLCLQGSFSYICLCLNWYLLPFLERIDVLSAVDNWS